MLSFMFSQCVMDHSGFTRMHIPKTRFNNCSLRHTNFVGADLTASSFDNCDLSDAKFENTLLEEADFRSAYNFTIDPLSNRIKNASFSNKNITGLLNRFDVRVHEPQSYSEQILDMLMLPCL